MAKFHFDHLNEAAVESESAALIIFALFGSGVLGRSQRVASPEMVREVIEKGVGEGIKRFREEGYAQAITTRRFRFRSEEGRRELVARSERVHERAKQLLETLKEISRRFEPDPDHPRGWRQGSPEYGRAVREAVRQAFPPLMTVARLRELVATYQRKLLNISVDGEHLAPPDVDELRLRAECFIFWAERLELYDAPLAPALSSKPRALRRYLRELSAFLKTAPDAEVWIELDPAAFPDPVQLTIARQVPPPSLKQQGVVADVETGDVPQPPFDLLFMEAVKMIGPTRKGTVHKMIKPQNSRPAKVETIARGNLTYLHRAQFEAELMKLNDKRSSGQADAAVPVGCNGYYCRSCNRWLQDNGPLPAACPLCGKNGTLNEGRRSA